MSKPLSATQIIRIFLLIIGGVPAGCFVLAILTFLIYALLSDPGIISCSIIALLVAGISIWLWRCSHRLMIAFLTVVIPLLSWWGIYEWDHRNLLSKYGVSWDISYGEHAEFQFLRFYWDRNGKRIEGPDITGDDLYVEFNSRGRDRVPDIVVRSETYQEKRVTLRLNFTDASKPEFEMVGHPTLGLEYFPPWSYFYETHEGPPD